jgi:hypothetical protein
MTSALPRHCQAGVWGGHGGQLDAPGGFFTDADFDYEARILLGAAASGIGDVGLVLATLDRITDGDHQSWFDGWTEMAADLAARGDEALRRGRPQTASWALLAAAEYYAEALVFVDGLAGQPVLLPTLREHRSCWDKVVDVSQGRIVRVQVPYEDTPLPAYLLRPDDTGAARPTLVVTNGSDRSLPGLLGYGAAEALDRGWNAFLFDGPGEQSMLFEHGVPFRYDLEAVLTPVIDFLAERPDVDASALQFFPGQPRQLYDLLPGEKEIIEFTPAQGANFHCQPTGRQLTHTQMLDWLAGHLPAPAGGGGLPGQTILGGSQA